MSSSTGRPLFTKLVETGEADNHDLQLEIRNWRFICGRGARSFPAQRSQEYLVSCYGGQITTWYLGIDCIHTMDHDRDRNVATTKIRPCLKSQLPRYDLQGSYAISILDRDGAVLKSGVYALNADFLTEELEKKSIGDLLLGSGAQFDYGEVAMTFSPERFWAVDPIDKTPALVGNDDILRIRCEISFAGIIKPLLAESFTKYSIAPIDESSNCVQSFNSLRKSEVLVDVFIHCGEKVFPAHKVILAARSQVFRDILQPNTKEFQDGKIIIKDVHSSTMEILLEFIYTGRIKKSLSDLPPFEELAIASHKFLLLGLKHYCIQRLVQHVTIENVIGTLSLLYKLKACRLLKSQLQGYIKTNLNFWADKPEVLDKIFEQRDIYLGTEQSENK